MKTRLFFLFFFCLSGQAFSQVFLNLDFEYPLAGFQKPRGWFAGGEGYTVALDEKIKQNGSYSVKCESNNPGKNQFAACTGSFPVDLVRGKKIEFSGWIRTNDVKDGYAGLWWRADGPSGSLGFDNMNDRGIKGTTAWKKVSIKMKVDEKVTNINFGGLFSGTGTAWFDNFEVLIDGVKFNHILPRTSGPTDTELSWLKKNIYPLKTCEPGGPVKDLEVLKTLIGNAHLVALGENTHGSSEIFKMKDRIIEYLAGSMGFDVFSIEANMPEAYRLNDYTSGNSGDATGLINGMYFWTWSTTEMLHMVEWMKKFNTPKKKITYTGFDMQFHQGSVRALKEAFTGNAKNLETIDQLGSLLDDLTAVRRKSRSYVLSSENSNKINEKITQVRSMVNDSKLPPDRKKWLLQCTRVLEQCTDVNNRDRYMAENLMWIRKQNQGSRIVAWAHNGHIQKTGVAMGRYLADSLKNDYLTIGFTFYKGSYTATGSNSLTSYPAQEAYQGTYEYFFNAINEPVFILDLRKSKENPGGGKWLTENLDFRNVGAMKTVNEFYSTNLPSSFDLVIFINETKPSTLLK